MKNKRKTSKKTSSGASEAISLSIIIEAAGEPRVSEEIVSALLRQARKVPVAEIFVIGKAPPIEGKLRISRAASTSEAVSRATGTHALLLGADLMPSENLLSRHLSFHRQVGRPAGLLGSIHALRKGETDIFSEYLNLDSQSKFSCRTGSAQRNGMEWPIFNAEGFAMNALPARSFRRDNLSLPLGVLRSVGELDDSLSSLCSDVDMGVRLAISRVPVFCDLQALAHRTVPVTMEQMEEVQAIQGAAYASVCSRYPNHFSIEEAMDECHADFITPDPTEVLKWRNLTRRIERHPRWREMRISQQDPVGGTSSTPALFRFYNRLLRYAHGRGTNDALVRIQGEDWVMRFRSSVGVWSATHSYIPVVEKATVDTIVGASGDSPLISVIIPVRNGAQKIELTLDSFRRQTIPADRIEIVCVDDGSTDRTPEILEAAAARGELRWFQQEAAGQAAATNRGIIEARGEYLFLTAADIIADENLIEQHMATHASNKRELLVLGYLPYAKNIDITPFMTFITRDGTQFGYNMIMYKQNLSPRFTYAPNLSLRREALLRAGLFDESFVFGVQDIELGVRLRLLGLKFVFNEKAIGFHNHPVSFRSFLDYRQPMAGRGTVLFSRKWPKLCPPHLLKIYCIGDYWRFSNTDLAERVENAIAKLEPMEERTRPILFTESPIEKSCMPILPFLYRWICKYHFSRGVFEALVEEEGTAWPKEMIAGGRCLGPIFPLIDEVLAALSEVPSNPATLYSPIEVAHKQTQIACLIQSPEYYESLQYPEFTFLDGEDADQKS